MQFINKGKSIILWLLFIFVGSFYLTGCSSFEATNENTIVNINRPLCKYYSEQNQTKISFDLSANNKTIYTIESLSVDFKLYCGETFVKQETYSIDCAIKYGKLCTETISFYEQNKITAIEFVDSNINYLDFFQTYKTWLISTLIVVSINNLGIIMVMIFFKNKVETIKDKVHQFLSQSLMLAIMIFIPIIGGVLATIRNNLIPFLIVIIGIFIICLFDFIVWRLKGLNNRKKC